MDFSNPFPNSNDLVLPKWKRGFWNSYEILRNPKIARTILKKKNQVGRLTLPNFKTSYKAFRNSPTHQNLLVTWSPHFSTCCRATWRYTQRGKKSELSRPMFKAETNAALCLVFQLLPQDSVLFTAHVVSNLGIFLCFSWRFCHLHGP